MEGLDKQFEHRFSGLQQLIGAPLHYVQEKLSVADSTEIPEDDASVRELGTIDVSRVNVDERNATSPDDSSQNHIPAGGVRISFTVPVDPMHEEALSILKKLQVCYIFTTLHLNLGFSMVPDMKNLPCCYFSLGFCIFLAY